MAETGPDTAGRPLSAAGADAVFRPVRTGNAFEEAVERILRAIKLGIVPTGGQLPPERELAVRLGVSRVTLREAIRALRQAGYVQSRRGRRGGTFVTYRPEHLRPPDARQLAVALGADLPDVLAFRSVLEPGAAALAAARGLDDDERAYLSQRLGEASEVSDDAYGAPNARLHLAIAELSGSRHLASAIMEVQSQLSAVLDVLPRLARAVAHSHDQHRQVVEAILAGDVERARRAMEAHAAATATLLTGFLTDALAADGDGASDRRPAGFAPAPRAAAPPAVHGPGRPFPGR